MRKTITSKLSWSTHIDNIISKANKMLGLLKRTFPLLQDISVRRTLYLSLVKSQLSYGCEIWSPHEFGCKRMLESVQRRATGWILMCRQGYISYKNRLIKLNLLRLAYDREVRDLVFFFKSIHEFTDCNIYNYHPVPQPTVNLGRLLHRFLSEVFRNLQDLWKNIYRQGKQQG